MRHVEVLFFAADPLSVAPSTRPRLLIDEEAREIRQKVRMSLYRNRLKLNTHWAARTDDLVQALNETQPQVVHFSGHGGGRGLVLVAADGTREHRVDTDDLQEFFRVFRGRIRLVVLNACLSLPQAQAIAEVVGCAIGTPEEITDGAAVTFAASFYRAIAFGHSVQTAFDQARAALKLERYEEHECPRLVHRKDVDPRRLVLVRPMIRQAALAATALLLTVTGVAAVVRAGDRAGTGPDTSPMDTSASTPADPPVHVVSDSTVGASANTVRTGDSVPAPVAAPAPGTPVGTRVAADLTTARDLYSAGNYAASFPLFKTLAEAGNPEAMAFLGIAYFKGEGTEKQPRLAVEWLTRAAEAGDARGMNALGVAYQDGTGVNQNLRLAKHWFEQAAQREYVMAMLNLGGYYRQYEDPEHGYPQALLWYRKAAEGGSLDAMVNLGMMFERGMGTSPSTEEALHWYVNAAEAGSARGMVAAGRAYEQRREYTRARAWYMKGVEAQSADAMNNMGVLFFNGWGVRRNREEAARWFRRAMEAGSADAAGNLAAMGAN